MLLTCTCNLPACGVKRGRTAKGPPAGRREPGKPAGLAGAAYRVSPTRCSPGPYRTARASVSSGRQDPLTAHGGVAEHCRRVSRPAHGVIHARQAHPTGQRVRVIGAEDLLRVRAALLGELHRGRHPPGRVISGGKSRAGRDRVWMAASEHPLTVGQDPFVMRDGILCLAVGQAGRGQAVPGGHGLRIAEGPAAAPGRPACASAAGSPPRARPRPGMPRPAPR